MIYSEGSDEHPRASEKAMLTLTVPPDVMDNIEKVISASNITFVATVNLKCWNFTGPIGDHYLYIHKKHWEPAELVKLTATRVFSDQNFDYIYDDPNYDGSYDVESPDVNVNIYRMLSRIEKHLKDVRSVVVTAIVVGLIVLIASKYLG